MSVQYKSNLSVGSLFSGIGGIERGLEAAGFTTEWFCEFNPYARAVLNKNFPGIHVYNDVRDIDGTVPAVDVLTGGFPCQDISQAGKGEGITGARSGLWKEYARIIGILRPSFVVVENVRVLRARGLDVVLGDLASLGYDAEWDCFPAKSVGAPHQRERLFIVAYPPHVGRVLRKDGVLTAEGWEYALSNLSASSADVADTDCQHTPERGEREDSPEEGVGGEDVGGRGRSVAGEVSVRSTGEGTPVFPHPDFQGLQGHGRELQLRETEKAEHPSGSGWWRTEPDVGRVAHGVPSRVDRLKCLGNAVVPQVAQAIGEMIQYARKGVRDATY